MARRAVCILGATVAAAGSLLVATSALGAYSLDFQINAQHSGNQVDPALDPPFNRLWKRQLPGPVSYSLIVGDRVFVTVAKPRTPSDTRGGSFLYALSRETGQTLWRRFLGGHGWAGITAGGGRVYALNDEGLMKDFGPATGITRWSLQLPGQSSFWAAPTYKQGLIYTAGNGTGQTMYAVTADGSIAWSKYSGATGASSPAVGSDRVFEMLDCPGGVIAYDRLTGHIDWNHSPGCSHGSATTPALYRGRVYARATTPDGYVLDAASGNVMAPFAWGTIPAFANGQGFQVENHELRAFDVQTGATNWTFTDPHAGTGGYLNSAPLVVNNHVLVGSAEGLLYAVDTANGNLDWHGHAGEIISWLDEWYGEAPLAGLAAGVGTLVVPADTAVVAYSGS